MYICAIIDNLGNPVKAILDMIAAHKAGHSVGMTSVCSAHPLVIKAACIHANRTNAPFVLIEATSNQVNQDGGYTGMTPAGFRDFVHGIADKVGLAKDRILLGGDHLGPNAWQHLSADEAMAKSEVLIDQYVGAGFRKIHLDCSMACADDKTSPSDETVASRAARLCAVSEATHARTGGEPPVYIIGTEVPVPGGAAEDLGILAVTTPAHAQATIEIHEKIFLSAGLEQAWQRVVGAVVQPGVEFDHHKVIDYNPAKAKALSAMIAGHDRIIFEAHSTDYQTQTSLMALVCDHFAILKVGPGITFALREALWALDAIERDWLGPKASGFRDKTLATMKRDPGHWSKYYHSSGDQLDIDLQYSLSDRIRYYWPDPAIAAAQAAMIRNLTANPPPLALISQYLPAGYVAIREGRIDGSPESLILEHIIAVLDIYRVACSARGDNAGA
jgi:D-tagatose-1,6-bisphosphate aldolase subunit GatZ/KbaZ